MNEVRSLLFCFKYSVQIHILLRFPKLPFKHHATFPFLFLFYFNENQTQSSNGYLRVR